MPLDLNRFRLLHVLFEHSYITVQHLPASHIFIRFSFVVCSSLPCLYHNPCCSLLVQIQQDLYIYYHLFPPSSSNLFLWTGCGVCSNTVEFFFTLDDMPPVSNIPLDFTLTFENSDSRQFTKLFEHYLCINTCTASTQPHGLCFYVYRLANA